jgi:hypothetical protein
MWKPAQIKGFHIPPALATASAQSDDITKTRQKRGLSSFPTKAMKSESRISILTTRDCHNLNHIAFNAVEDTRPRHKRPDDNLRGYDQQRDTKEAVQLSAQNARSEHISIGQQPLRSLTEIPRHRFQ